MAQKPENKNQQQNQAPTQQEMAEIENRDVGFQQTGGASQGGTSTEYTAPYDWRKDIPIGYGTEEEREAQKSGMNLANILYGQNIFDIGEDVSKLRGEYKGLAEAAGSDPISAAIMAQKGADITQAGRSMRQAGVKGGVAAGAMQDIANQSNAQVARSLYGQKSQALDKLRSFTGNTLAGTTALMKGGQAQGTQMPQAPGTWTVICTELYNQGYMPEHIYTKDGEYGKTVSYEVLTGYHFVAIPLVKLMKKSNLITKIISIPALSWAYHIAGEKKSVFGYFCQKVGEPVCGLIGKALITFGVKYVR